jgi:hypothetical protein
MNVYVSILFMRFLECDPICNTCINESNCCLECKSSNNFILNINGSCTCLNGYFMDSNY